MTDKKYHDEDPYQPAERPPGNIPGGKHVRFEREGNYEQSIFGGGAQDVEAAILANTAMSMKAIGKKVKGVGTVKGDLGSGDLTEVTISFAEGGGLTIRGDDMEVEEF
jgi:hypothetical protein